MRHSNPWLFGEQQFPMGPAPQKEQEKTGKDQHSRIFALYAQTSGKAYNVTPSFVARPEES